MRVHHAWLTTMPRTSCARILIVEDVETEAELMMGTMKTGFVAHGMTFTGGIPTSQPFEASRAAFEASAIRSRMAVAAAGSEVELWLRVKAKSNITLRGRSLTEGLVIREDIRDAHGMVLIKGGSRLTQTAAERLAKLVPDVEITVSDPSG
jgi:hypothetical protein